MTTRTKAKGATWAPPFLVQIRVRDKDFAPLCDELEIDPRSGAGERLRADLDQTLTVAFNHMRAAWERPAAAHIRAELEPIERAARELASLLDPSQLSVGTLVAMEHPAVDSGEAKKLMTHIAQSAAQAIGRLKDQSSRGSHHERRTEALRSVEETLRRFFQAHAAEDAKGDPDSEAAFVERCMRYMPKTPGSPGRKSKPAK